MTFEDFQFSQIGNATAGHLSVGQYRVMIEQNRNNDWVMKIVDKGSNYLTSKFTQTWDDEQSHPMTVDEVNQVLEKISRHSNDI